jgi:hypothetical protein
MVSKGGPREIQQRLRFVQSRAPLIETFRARSVPGHTSFQLLADGNLTGDQWKRLRAIATERAAELTDNALALRAKLSRERSQ